MILLPLRAQYKMWDLSSNESVSIYWWGGEKESSATGENDEAVRVLLLTWTWGDAGETLFTQETPEVFSGLGHFTPSIGTAVSRCWLNCL